MCRISLIEGDGIGFEVTRALRRVLRAADADIRWELFEAGQRHFEKTGVFIGEDFYESMEKTKTAIKGPMDTPKESGYKSAISHLRQEYDLMVHESRIKGSNSIVYPYGKIDLSIFYENDDHLLKEEENFEPSSATKIFTITREGTKRAIELAKKQAIEKNLYTITLVLSEDSSNYFDDLFLDIVKSTFNEESSSSNGDKNGINLKILSFNQFIKAFIKNPTIYNIILTQGKYGEIIENVATGLIDSCLLFAKGNFGKEYAIFEPSHGSLDCRASNNMANPTDTLFTGCMLLEYLGKEEVAERVQLALDKSLEYIHSNREFEKPLSTDDFTDLVISKLNS